MPRSTDTPRRAWIILLALDWAIAIALTLGLMISWLADPGQAPKGASQFLFGLLFMFGLLSFDVGLVLFLLVGVPWAILHLLGARPFWVAPVAGFVVAFGLAFHHTYWIGHQDPRLDTSMWEPDGTPIITHGRLTAYGETLYGTEAAVWSGVALGLFGAPFASVLWWLAYPEPWRRRRAPDRPMDGSAPRESR